MSNTRRSFLTRLAQSALGITALAVVPRAPAAQRKAYTECVGPYPQGEELPVMYFTKGPEPKSSLVLDWLPLQSTKDQYAIERISFEDWCKQRQEQLGNV